MFNATSQRNLRISAAANTNEFSSISSDDSSHVLNSDSRGKTARGVQCEAARGGGDRGEAAYSLAVKLSNRICRESESETSELNPHSSLTDNKYWKLHAYNDYVVIANTLHSQL